MFGYRDGMVSCRYIRNQINAGAVKREVPLTALEKAALDFSTSRPGGPTCGSTWICEPGDIQFINNYTTLHSRTGFVDGPEPHQKRHMLRLWLKFPKHVAARAPSSPPHMGYKPGAGHSDPRRSGGLSPMPKVLTEEQVRDVRARRLPVARPRDERRARAATTAQKFEALEARVPDIKKMKTKSHLLCPWVLDIAEDPHILDIFEDLIGPNIRCWSMAWRVKKADGETFAGWHQDSAYGAAHAGRARRRSRCPTCGVTAGLPARRPRLAQVGRPQARGERRPEEHPRPRPVHHRPVRRVEGRGLRAPARARW